ncbi:hypothetical protein ACIBQ6_00175 [Nonomuraea sp. NPDC049655]|uniref:hypothetical protein n=1 Tax=Nonomuraea sp. NPDC049655 TaxID=3364355 RepID=UPI00379DAAB3
MPKVGITEGGPFHLVEQPRWTIWQVVVDQQHGQGQVEQPRPISWVGTGVSANHRVARSEDDCARNGSSVCPKPDSPIPLLPCPIIPEGPGVCCPHIDAFVPDRER